MLCTALATEIREPFLLLLCNYEEVNESETVNALVHELLRRFPPQATLIIESRSIPDLSFPALITREAIYGLDHEALRFSAEEIAELAALQGLPPLSEEEAASLVTSFDGWIAGILLGTRIGDARVRLLLHQASAADEKRGSFTTPMVQKRATLLTYLTDEVLKHDAQTQSFLQSISLLHHVDPLFCNELLDITDAQERLAHLERQGLFVFSHASSTGLFYTIHPVVRELLSEQLRQRKAERFRQLHRRAAELWHARHEDEEAMYHALESESYDLAVSFILATAENLLSLGQRETLMRWINMLPEALREHHPRLLLLQATIALDYGQRTTALPLLDCAEALLTTSQEPDTALLEATCAILRSKALFQAGDYQQAQLLCQKAVLYLPEQERHLRASAQMRLGICHTLQGDLTGGVMHLHRLCNSGLSNLPLKVSGFIMLASTYYLLGNLVLAQHHLTALLEACEQLRDTLGQVSARILQGLIAQDEGRIAEAEAILLEVLSLARSSPYSRRGEAYALVNLAGIALEQGDYARALACAQEGLSLARTFGTRSLVNAALSNLALSYLCLRDPTSALLMAEQMEAETTDEKAAGYERAWRDLTIGLIFLAQGRYAEAATCLRGIAVALHRTHLQRARLQAELRLAVCYYLQHQPERAEHALGEVVSILRAQPTFAHLAQQEWRLLRTFLPELGKHPCFAALEALLASTPQTQVALPTALQPPVPSPSTTVVISQERVAASLTIYAFGEPMVLLNGQPIKHWRMARAMELFFFLGCRYRSVRR
ncbi:MAG: hypothetical protein IMW90_18105 [Thermogemmatispora sp.]|uniref:tetratricopeptide repeat protein n=1 Tax=Thermogemmatispora sp. TaxID=1968838 RepID=UPI001A08AF22|nr:tetratricopeptide repeat protein [Thermogemmatispora sp.]MBE3567633.1 hypothetical protein [Thermogemmatispora sp.]